MTLLAAVLALIAAATGYAIGGRGHPRLGLAFAVTVIALLIGGLIGVQKTVESDRRTAAELMGWLVAAEQAHYVEHGAFSSDVSQLASYQQALASDAVRVTVRLEESGSAQLTLRLDGRFEEVVVETRLEDPVAAPAVRPRTRLV